MMNVVVVVVVFVVFVSCAIQSQVWVSAMAMPNGPFGCSASDFFQNENHRLVSEAAPVGPTVHGFADRLDPEHACLDSIDNTNLSTNECDAYWPPALILFQWHWYVRRTMDFDIVRSTH